MLLIILANRIIQHNKEFLINLCALARAIKASGRRSSESNTTVSSICMGTGVNDFNTASQ